VVVQNTKGHGRPNLPWFTRLLVALIVGFAITLAGWIAVFFFTSYWVPESARDRARAAAATRGHRMEGSYSEFTSQPGLWGQARVRVVFADTSSPEPHKKVEVDLRRNNFFSGWDVTNISEIP
jgi:hypothetical protein